MAHSHNLVEFFVDSAGGHRFRIKGRNHEIVATSESYMRAAGARRGLLDLVHLIDVIRTLPEGRELGMTLFPQKSPHR